MDILKRRFRDVEREFRIYSRAEADEAGIKYVPWREAKEGSWVLSDDGYVGECLDIHGPYGSLGVRYLTFSFGKAWGNECSVLNYSDRIATGDFYNTSNKHWSVLEANKQRCKNLVDAYVAMFMVGKIDWIELGKIYRPDQKHPAKAVKFIINQKVVKKMIDKKLQDIFRDKGITEGDVIDKYNTIYSKANRTKNPDLRVMKSVTDEFRDMLDMKPKPRATGYLYPGEAEDADFDELEEKVDKAIGTGQKRIEQKGKSPYPQSVK